MKRKRAGRELFEVFRSRADKDPAHAWWLKRSDGDKGKPQTKRSRSKTSRRDATTPPGRVTVTFSREALIVGIVFAAGALLGAFALGYSRGRPRDTNTGAYVAQSDPASSTGTELAPYSTLTLNVPNAKGYYTLRLMDGLTRQQAVQLVADLMAMGYNDAFSWKSGDTYNVNVGRYADYRTKDAEQLKLEIAARVINGKRWFSSAYWLKVGSPEE
jgi:hypothetical protein